MMRYLVAFVISLGLVADSGVVDAGHQNTVLKERIESHYELASFMKDFKKYAIDHALLGFLPVNEENKIIDRDIENSPYSKFREITMINQDISSGLVVSNEVTASLRIPDDQFFVHAIRKHDSVELRVARFFNDLKIAQETPGELLATMIGSYIHFECQDESGATCEAPKDVYDLDD